MTLYTWLQEMVQFMIVIPAVFFCYLPMKNQMKYTRGRIFLLCTIMLTLYIPAATVLALFLNVEINVILLPSLIVFFLLFYKTVKTDFARTLAVFVNACAVMSFPAVYAYIFDAYRHPASGAVKFSLEAGIFQFAISALLVLMFAFPLHRFFSWMLDALDFPMVWYATTAFPALLTLFNLSVTPYSYQTLHTGRIMPLFLWLEIIILLLLLFLYVLFYHVAVVISEHAKQEEEVHFLELQAEQYEALQNHIHQTRRLRHDFRHMILGMTGLADSGDYETLRDQLREYKNELDLNTPVIYCYNAALNALFNYYREMAVSEQIEMDWKLSLPEPLTISELDLCSLLGNLIENAIAGCKTVSEEHRFFSLSIMVKNTNCLYIVSTNSFNGTVRRTRNGYLSTKRNGDGLGLFSMKTISEKYKGTAQFSDSNGNFYVNIMLKI